MVPLNTPAEEHHQGLLERDERVRGPLALGASAVEELAHLLLGALLDVADLLIRAEQQDGRAVATDRLRGVPPNERRVVAELIKQMELPAISVEGKSGG